MLLMEGVARVQELCSDLAGSLRAPVASRCWHEASVIWQVFTEHLLYVKHSARLCECSCESVKNVFTSQSHCSGRSEGEIQHCRPGQVPTQASPLRDPSKGSQVKPEEED